MLLADDGIQTRVFIIETVESLVIGEGWADENDVIKAAAEWTKELVYEKLRLARVGRTNN